MKKNDNLLVDSFGRNHNYLRISLTERCNLRCIYCMPMNGIKLSPKENIMNKDEIFTLANIFVQNGVNKIRLTGGEPLVRKDFPEILEKLSKIPSSLSLTSNAVLIDRYINLFQKYNLTSINVSLDTLNSEKFKEITLRNDFSRVMNNIELLIKNNFKLKINVVLMKGVNDEEIINFIKFTKNRNISLRFIEFMPFSGNKWKKNKIVSMQSILNKTRNYYGKNNLLELRRINHQTSKNYKIKGYVGSFGIISTVTNPFCDQCNRIRITADGKIKNCLFSNNEIDLLTPLRNGKGINNLIKKLLLSKKLIRSGMEASEVFENFKKHEKNRSMIAIGG